MGEKKVVDLSRFFLFEAAGDSEAGFDHDHTSLVSLGMVGDQEHADHDDADHDDDDAESCSYDVGYCDTPHSRDTQVEILGKGHDDHTHDVDEDEDEDLDEDIRDDCIDDDDDDHHGYDDGYDDEMVSSEVTSTANSYASRKCAGSSKRKMSEIEKSRLFWEACLAS